MEVHPDDAHYTHLHGELMWQQFAPQRTMPTVCDALCVDMVMSEPEEPFTKEERDRTADEVRHFVKKRAGQPARQA